MNIKKDIATSDNGFVFNPATGDSFTANKLAAEIIGWMKNGKNELEIKADILAKYEVKPMQLEQDWDDLIMQLKQAKLVE